MRRVDRWEGSVEVRVEGKNNLKKCPPKNIDRRSVAKKG